MLSCGLLKQKEVRNLVNHLNRGNPFKHQLLFPVVSTRSIARGGRWPYSAHLSQTVHLQCTFNCTWQNIPSNI